MNEINEMILDLASKLEARMRRYKQKKKKATGTDVINQSCKIKATRECLQDVYNLYHRTRKVELGEKP